VIREIYLLSVTLHLLAALVWLGGMFFFALVGAPLLRTIEPPALRGRLFHVFGVRFRAVGWSCIAILLATGLLNLWFRGQASWEVLGSYAFWASPYGRALGGKLVAVMAMVVISAVHDFVDGPRSGRLEPGSPESAGARRRAALLARVNALIGVLVVILAVRLAR
jgi:uncharacterized membrane protein